MYPHRIRLRGPWECELLSGQPPPAPLRIRFPASSADSDLADYSGPARFRRRFGRPTNLDQTERVWLTLRDLPPHARVLLNGQEIPLARDLEQDITSLVEPRNEVVIEMDITKDSDWFGDVALEIRRTAFLRDVRFEQRDARLVVEGEIAGFSDQPLETYLVIGRRNAAYGVFSAAGSFRLETERLEDGGTQPVRLDLVGGATVWYTVETMLDLGEGG
jgi:hypothetical protein